MSMALQAARLLCSRLVQARSSSAGTNTATWQLQVRSSYAAEWRRQFVPRMRLAAIFAHLAVRPITSAAMLALFQRWPALLTRGAAWAGKVSCATDATPIMERARSRSESDLGHLPTSAS